MPSGVEKGNESPAVGTGAGVRPSDARIDRLQYRELLARIREVVRRHVPAEASILAISRGDAGLLDIEGRRVSHFPQNEQGVYAGFHPADSTAAITHLEILRSRGAEYLLIPATSFWWLQHYKPFRRHLESRYPVVSRDQDTCIIFSLASQVELDESLGESEDRGYRALVGQIREVVDALLPDKAITIVLSGGDDALLRLGGRKGWHFPQNERGVYAGYYPADSGAAIEHLESLRAKGADYLVIPRTNFWWLTYYREFAEHLTSRCRVVTRQPHVCMIYALKQQPPR